MMSVKIKVCCQIQDDDAVGIIVMILLWWELQTLGLLEEKVPLFSVVNVWGCI